MEETQPLILASHSSLEHADQVSSHSSPEIVLNSQVSVPYQQQELIKRTPSPPKVNMDAMQTLLQDNIPEFDKQLQVLLNTDTELISRIAAGSKETKNFSPALGLVDAIVSGMGYKYLPCKLAPVVIIVFLLNAVSLLPHFLIAKVKMIKLRDDILIQKGRLGLLKFEVERLDERVKSAKLSKDEKSAALMRLLNRYEDIKRTIVTSLDLKLECQCQTSFWSVVAECALYGILIAVLVYFFLCDGEKKPGKALRCLS